VYDSIRAWTCKLRRIEKLYAFSYQPQAPEKGVNYWGLYDPMKEWRRMGVGKDEAGNKWRISKINTDYGVSENPSHTHTAKNISFLRHIQLYFQYHLPSLTIL